MAIYLAYIFWKITSKQVSKLLQSPAREIVNDNYNDENKDIENSSFGIIIYWNIRSYLILQNSNIFNKVTKKRICPIGKIFSTCITITSAN